MGNAFGKPRLGGGKAPSKTFLYDGDEALQVRLPVKAGLHQVMATMLKTDDAEPEGPGPDRLPLFSRASDNATSPIAIAALLIGGPYGGPGSGRFAQPPSFSLSAIPLALRTKFPAQRKFCPTWRGVLIAVPPTDEDVETLLSFYKRARDRRNFRRWDSRRAGTRAGEPRFSVPHREPIRRASRQAPRIVFPMSSWLRDYRSFCGAAFRTTRCWTWQSAANCMSRRVLEQQVSRMFADPRARTSLVENFFSDWLETRNVWLLNPDGTKFPFFDDNLRSAFVTETELFLDAQLKEDTSVTDLLTSNETFLNEQLARHYGISGVYGSHFRRVILTDENRFGLLGKASVLAVTSYTTRTAPTIRGKWVLENILSAPPPAPPPNVPSLESSNKDGKPLSVRQMLEMHRANPACASCHARMDPLGLSLENFDAIGQWRTTDAGTRHRRVRRIAGRHEGGGPRELRQALMAQKTQFVKTVTDKLLTYALGRGLEYYDAPTVRAIDRSAAADDYRWSSIILEYCEERAVSDENRRPGHRRPVTIARN